MKRSGFGTDFTDDTVIFLLAGGVDQPWPEATLLQDEWIPCILEPDESSKERRKNWARLIQKIYESDPLCCPRCSGRMKVISVMEGEDVIKKILKHLGLWDRKPRPPPKANSPPMTVDYTDSQLPASGKRLYVDPVYPETFAT